MQVERGRGDGVRGSAGEHLAEEVLCGGRLVGWGGMGERRETHDCTIDGV